MNTRTIFYTDGGCLGSNKKEKFSVVGYEHIKSNRLMAVCVTDVNGNVICYKTVEGGTNNIAEFIAIKECMGNAILNGIQAIEIRTDSTNNICWFRKIRNGTRPCLHGFREKRI